jgi:hypothetical protein
VQLFDAAGAMKGTHHAALGVVEFWILEVQLQADTSNTCQGEASSMLEQQASLLRQHPEGASLSAAAWSHMYSAAAAIM